MRPNPYSALWVLIYLGFVLSLGNFSHAWDKQQNLILPATYVALAVVGMVATVAAALRAERTINWHPQ